MRTRVQNVLACSFSFVRVVIINVYTIRRDLLFFAYKHNTYASYRRRTIMYFKNGDNARVGIKLHRVYDRTAYYFNRGARVFVDF